MGEMDSSRTVFLTHYISDVLNIFNKMKSKVTRMMKIRSGFLNLKSSNEIAKMKD